MNKLYYYNSLKTKTNNIQINNAYLYYLYYFNF